MSDTTTISAFVPTWTLGNRMWRARQHTGLTQQQLADRLGIGLKAIKEAEADKRTPKRAVILGWAVACSVDPMWLEHGEDEDDPERGVTAGSMTGLAA